MICWSYKSNYCAGGLTAKLSVFSLFIAKSKPPIGYNDSKLRQRKRETGGKRHIYLSCLFSPQASSLGFDSLFYSLHLWHVCRLIKLIGFLLIRTWIRFMRVCILLADAWCDRMGVEGCHIYQAEYLCFLLLVIAFARLKSLLCELVWNLIFCILDLYREKQELINSFPKGW